MFVFSLLSGWFRVYHRGFYQHVCSHLTCACFADGIHFAAAIVNHTAYHIYMLLEGPVLKAEKAVGMDTWSNPAHDTFIGMVLWLTLIIHPQASTLPLQSWVMQAASSV